MVDIICSIHGRCYGY